MPCPTAPTHIPRAHTHTHISQLIVSDVDIGQVQDESGNTVRGLWVRFKKIKQDQRVERPEARGDGDWAFVGDVADSRYSIIAWFVRLMGFHIAVLNARRDPDEPFFLETGDGRRRPLRRLLGLLRDPLIDDGTQRIQHLGVLLQGVVVLLCGIVTLLGFRDVTPQWEAHTPGP